MKNLVKVLNRLCNSAGLAIGIFAVAALGSAANALAADIPVTTLDDSGAASLRQAIADAFPGDTVTFSVHGTVILTSGALTIDKDLTIEGPGPYHLRISGNHASRVFVIRPTRSVSLSGMTISDGLADGNSPFLPCVGGGILNGATASLLLSNVVVSGNQAIGDAAKAPFNFPGSAYAGGIMNLGTMAISDSLFIGNMASGADGITSPTVAGFGGGGAIFSTGRLTVNSCQFIQNQGIGGNNNSSLYLSGHGFAGAILGSGLTGEMVIQDSDFFHNQAIGGNRNMSPTVPAAVGANKASGGAINIAGGRATIDGCTLDHNWSIGGSGAPGADGGIGAGGAMVATNFNGANTNVTITNSMARHNKALGGPGGNSGGNGGEGVGGGLTSTQGAMLTVIKTTVAYNHARGGKAGAGGIGGNGLGGGLYDYLDYTSPPTPPTATVLILEGATVTKNLALGGPAKKGCNSRGLGIGGGVYYLGSFSFDDETVIEKNQASTSSNNVGP